MAEPIRKGTMTSLSSMFPAEDAQKAAKCVQDTITEKQQELDTVKEFIADNTNLINLVQKLPEELHHDIMVPFGKAAFFPGRLIHTNEILVLLGEGYYAERTSKQTVEILKRRGKDLESQVNSLKATMKDLQAEASFFDATASEAAEGLVEIREEYSEEKSETSESGLLKQDSSVSEANNFKDEDEEYARIMSRLDELELEELAAESDNWDDDGKKSNTVESDNESNEDEQAKADFDPFPDQSSFDHNLRHPHEFISSKPLQQTKDKITTSETFSNDHYQQKFATDQSCTGLTVQAVPKDAVLHGKALAGNANSISVQKSDNVGAVPSSRKEVSAQTSKAGFDSGKAFTGSIVEHTQNVHTSTEKPSGNQPSKPVSRFKMQRK